MNVRLIGLSGLMLVVSLAGAKTNNNNKKGNNVVKNVIKFPFRVTEEAVCVPPNVAALLVDPDGVRVCPGK